MSAERELLTEAVTRLEGIVLSGSEPLHLVDARWIGSFMARARQLDVEKGESPVTRQELVEAFDVMCDWVASTPGFMADPDYTKARNNMLFRLERGMDARGPKPDNAEESDGE